MARLYPSLPVALTLIIGLLVGVVIEDLFVRHVSNDEFAKFYGTWAAIGETIALLAGVIVAAFSYGDWKRELAAKRNSDSAVETLTAARRFQAAMRQVRAPVSFAGEGGTRPPEPNERQDQIRDRDAAFIPLERFHNQRDDLFAIDKTGILCRVLFGAAVETPLHQLQLARSHFYVMAQQRYVNRIRNLVLGDHFENAVDAAIWRDFPDAESDEIGRNIGTALADLERILKPVIV